MVLNQKHLSLAREKIESGLLRRVGGLDLIHRVSEHVRQGHSRGRHHTLVPIVSTLSLSLCLALL